MVKEFPGNVVEQHDALFMKGNLGMNMEPMFCVVPLWEYLEFEISNSFRYQNLLSHKTRHNLEFGVGASQVLIDDWWVSRKTRHNLEFGVGWRQPSTD